MATSLARAHSRRRRRGHDSSWRHSHARYAAWFATGGSVRLHRILACAVFDIGVVSPVHSHATCATHDAAARSRDGLCVDRGYIHPRVFARSAAQHRYRFFNRNLVRRANRHRAKNYMAGSQNFWSDVSDHRLGSADYFAVGLSSRRLHEFVALRTWWHRLHSWRGFVLSQTSATSTSRVWLPRGVACLHCCCCCSAICWRWRSDCPRRLTPSETMVAGIKNARP